MKNWVDVREDISCIALLVLQNILFSICLLIEYGAISMSSQRKSCFSNTFCHIKSHWIKKATKTPKCSRQVRVFLLNSFYSWNDWKNESKITLLRNDNNSTIPHSLFQTSLTTHSIQHHGCSIFCLTDVCKLLIIVI